ncbi:MAG: hypothetical protein AUG51_20975 [Acidobacteria bacterium 13_1_20CM_3_53_8]|nr:MAG: hypothetical protein AUG51_20975 [Acidobacteria bacterium 13_1_20CM_3_53_8]
MPYENEFAHYKPIKRITESVQVQALLKRARVKPDSPESISLDMVALTQLKPSDWTPDFVLAIDGSMDEERVKNGYPSAAIGYVTVASVLLDVAKMMRLDAHRPVDPKEFRTIENAESIDGALPGCNVVIDEELSAVHSFRRALFELFQCRQMSESEKCESVLDTYQALLKYKPINDNSPQRCPYEDCLQLDQSYQRGQDEYICSCAHARSLFSTDALRIHEFMKPEGSNQSMLTETMNVLERIWMVHFLRTLEQEKLLPVLQRLAIVMDGPLAVFGAPAWLSSAIKSELSRINDVAKQAVADDKFDLLLFGVEKTGAFMEHLTELDKGPNGEHDTLPRQSAMLLTDDYIKQRIIFSNSEREYGRNTYFGRKAFYKTTSGALIVLNSPLLNEDHGDLKRAEYTQFPRLADIMSLLDTLVSARYRNSVTPLISAHAEAAIPMNLGKRVLEKLARQLMSETSKKKA